MLGAYHSGRTCLSHVFNTFEFLDPTGYGQFLFWNAQETKMIVIEKADPASNLLSNFAVAIMSPARKPLARSPASRSNSCEAAVPER